MGVVTKRLFQLGFKMKINTPTSSDYGYKRHLSHIANPNEIVDTLAVLRSLEAKGVPSKKAEAITFAMTKVLNNSLKHVSDTYVSHADMQKTMIPPHSKFECEVQSIQERHFMKLEHENSKLRVYIEKMNNDLSRKIEHDFQGLKTELHVIRRQLEGQQDAMKAELHVVRLDVIKYCMATFVSLSVVGIPVIRLWFS